MRNAGHTSSVDAVAAPPGYKPPRLPKELLRRYRSGDRYFANTSIDGADLEDAVLSNGDYSNGSFCEANLLGVDLSGSKLCAVNLSFCNLGDCNLDGADLQGTRLVGTDLFFTRLVGARFDGACFGRTALCGLDLGLASGLELAVHRFPSFLSTDTLVRSAGKLPTEFLVGAGLLDWEIEAARLHAVDLDAATRSRIHDRLAALREVWPTPPPPVFVCHGEPDDAMASELAAQLQGAGVRCWRHVYGCEPDSTDGASEGDRWMRRDGVSVVVISEPATHGKWLAGELAHARTHDGPLDRHLIAVTIGESWQRADWDRKARDAFASLDAVELDANAGLDAIARAATELCERLRDRQANG